MHVKIKGNQAFIDGKPSINKTEGQYIDGPPVNKNQRNRWNTCTGIPVGSRTDERLYRCFSIYSILTKAVVKQDLFS